MYRNVIWILSYIDWRKAVEADLTKIKSQPQWNISAPLRNDNNIMHINQWYLGFFLMHKILVTFDLLEIWFFNNTYMILCQTFPKSVSALTSTTLSQGDQSHTFPGCWARRCTRTHGEGAHERLGHKKSGETEFWFPRINCMRPLKKLVASVGGWDWHQIPENSVSPGPYGRETKSGKI